MEQSNPISDIYDQVIYDNNINQPFRENYNMNDKINDIKNDKMKRSLAFQDLIVAASMRNFICGFLLILSTLLSVISYIFDWKYVTPQRIFMVWLIIFILFSLIVIYYRIKLYLTKDINTEIKNKNM